MSSNLSHWYPDWELCAVRNNTARDIHSWKAVVKSCTDAPGRWAHICFAGGTFKRHFCHFGRNLSDFVLMSYDSDVDNNYYQLKLVDELSKLQGSIYFDGDSQMTNLKHAFYCDLYRHGLQSLQWSKNPLDFKYNGHMVSVLGTATTDDDIQTGLQLVVKRVNATLADGTTKHMLVIANIGTHYNVFNGSKSVENFQQKLDIVLPFWNGLGNLFPRHRLDVAWMETPPQHFDSENGYYNNELTKCVPIVDPSPTKDWRNRMVRESIQRLKLHNITIVSTRHLVDLHSEHCGGDHTDCTHYSYWPMLNQPIYRDLYNIVKRKNKSALRA